MANSLPYNTQEKKTIDKAFSILQERISCTDHTGSNMLAEALKHEKRERRSMTTAKALLVRGFMNGWQRNPQASDLYGVSDGIMKLELIGASARERFPEHFKEWLSLFNESSAAHDAAWHRYAQGS